MYFLDTISGLSGETLVSAVLKYLLLNSGQFRALFVERISQSVAPSNIPLFRNGIQCQTEVAFPEGRVDLLIRADNVILGVENKLWAALQEGQPKRYVSALSGLAQQYGFAADGFCLVLIAPEQREKEIRSAISAQDLGQDCITLWWSQMLLDLRKVEKEEAGAVAVVAGFLAEYVATHVERAVTELIPSSALVGKCIKIKNRYHYDLLYRIRDIFPFTGKIASGTSHVGFSFRAADNEQAPWHWIGFISDHDCCQFEVHTAPLTQSVSVPITAKHVGKSASGGQRWQLTVPNQAKMEEWSKLFNGVMGALNELPKQIATDNG